MSQVWYEGVGLTNLVERSTHILLVRAASPPSREELIPLNQPTYDGGECPPFKLYFGRFEVLEALRGEVPLDEVVEIAAPRWSDDLRSHIAYYVEGLSESPIIENYEPQGAIDGDELIVFAVAGNRGLQYAVPGAVEGPEYLDTVRDLIAQAPENGLVALDEDTWAE